MIRSFAIIVCILLCSQTAGGQYKAQYYQADSIASLYPGYPITNLPYLAHLLTDSLENDLDKYRSIFKWVTSNISNDYYLFRENIKQRERLQNKPDKLQKWSRRYKIKVFNKLNQSHITMCTGYAYLIKEMCVHAGLKCEIINGYGRTPQTNVGELSLVNHSWNAIMIDQNWYLSDATWSSGYIRSDNKSFVPVHGDSYFIIDPKLFWRSHYPEDNCWFLMDNPPSVDDFINGALVYSSFYSYGLELLSDYGFFIELRKNEVITIALNNKGISSDIEYLIYGGSRKLRHITSPISDSLTHLTFSFKKPGLYDLLIKGNNKALISYQIKVK